jgi:mRNA-degrading endonuclease RelE of RelBE toxin-antitoxin system
MILQPAPFGATWELRFGPRNSFRAFYDVDNDARIVLILAIGVKKGNRLFIGGEEFSV